MNKIVLTEDRKRDPHCRTCGCPKSLHSFTCCSGGRCMCPGLVLSDDDYDELERLEEADETNKLRSSC
jgi:hypothetical protein